MVTEIAERQRRVLQGNCPYCNQPLKKDKSVPYCVCRFGDTYNYHAPDALRTLAPLRPEDIAPRIRQSVLQAWVTELGLRHQGCLVAAVRGPDTAMKEDPAKAVVRCYRPMVLNAFVGDAKRATTFMEVVDDNELCKRLTTLTKSFDHYPIHWALHLLHATEIVGYKHPTNRMPWLLFYKEMCRKMHVTPEAEAEMDARLLADETSFGKANNYSHWLQQPKT